MSEIKTLSYKTTKIVLDDHGILTLDVILKGDDETKYVLSLPCKDGFSDDASAFIKQIQNGIDKALVKQHKQIWGLK